MSYCRFGEADVYVYPSVMGGIECCACRLNQGESQNLPLRSQMIEHLHEHQIAGHHVPARVFQRLEREIVERGDAA